MNKKAQRAVFGFALPVIAFVFIITALATIEPFKEALDDARDTDSLNCPGTLNFNQTDYDDDDRVTRLTRRTTCFATGISMVYFVGSFIIAVFVWIVANWRRLK